MNADEMRGDTQTGNLGQNEKEGLNEEPKATREMKMRNRIMLRVTTTRGKMDHGPIHSKFLM